MSHSGSERDTKESRTVADTALSASIHQRRPMHNDQPTVGYLPDGYVARVVQRQDVVHRCGEAGTPSRIAVPLTHILLADAHDLTSLAASTYGTESLVFSARKQASF